MLPNIRPMFLVVFIMVLLAGCAAPTPTAVATMEVPTSTSLPPTEAKPTITSTPGISGVQVSIPVGAGNETFNATVTGNGEVGVILANSIGNDPLRWLPLIDALDSNENMRIVTFAFRNEDATANEDTRAVFDYLRAEGIDKIICVGAGYGSAACSFLQTEPEMIGMVVFAIPNMVVINSGFPKLFITPDSGNYTGIAQRAYDGSTEPKIFKAYAASVDGNALFFKADVGPQVLADITDFINGIVSDQ